MCGIDALDLSVISSQGILDQWAFKMPVSLRFGI